MKRLIFVLLLSLTLGAVWVSIAAAQKSTPSDDEVNAIARQLYCPVCENTPLDVCPTPACHDWRELIRQMLAEGKSPDEIKQYFVDHYGARVLPEPPAKGFNWLVYVVPPVAFLVGAFLLFQAFRIWRGQKKSLSKTESVEINHGVDEGYVAELEEELRKRK